MEIVKAVYRGHFPAAIRFDGTKECAAKIAESPYFKGSITYDSGVIREFNFFDIFTKKYTPVHEGDWFILCNAHHPTEQVVYVHLKPMAFHTLFDTEAITESQD